MPSLPKGQRHPAELRERAVRMVFEHQHEYPSQWKAIESIAGKLDIHHETLRLWVRRAEVDERPTAGADDRGAGPDEGARAGEQGAAPSE